MTQQIAFRVDASLVMGSGHVMRCLTLADALAARGAQCHFVSRAHSGHLFELIGRRGFPVAPLPVPAHQSGYGIADDPAGHTGHASWLGCDWQTDARQSGELLAALEPDWLVVDHYALDRRWECAVEPHYKKLMVIDDLVDRKHCCDLLLDQNLGRQVQDYAALVPAACQVLAGPRFALLGPQFGALRNESIERRANAQLKRLLITMGGVDLANATARVLETLANGGLPQDCRITVVMGATAPWLEQVRALAGRMPWPTEVVVNIADMARRMADSDLAIGAAGSTSWERCCLALPTLLVVLADNQRPGAAALQAAGAVQLIGDVDEIAMQLLPAIKGLGQGPRLNQMSQAAAAVANGGGVAHVLMAMEVLND